MNSNTLFELKKGDLSALKGTVIVYARVREPGSTDNLKNPVHDMAKNGLLCTHGDFRTQNSLRDFLKKELGMSLEDLGKSDNLGEMSGLPEGADPALLRRKLESMKGYEELIPTPSKLEHFENEQEILSRDCDVFYLGEFDRVANANLAVNALPILYQAVYREQVARSVSQEIERMLTGVAPDVHADNFAGDLSAVEKRLTTEFISEIIYNRDNPVELSRWSEKLKNYMWGYKYPGEVDKIIDLASANQGGQKEAQWLLERYVRKIAAFLREDYKTVGELKKEIETGENRLSGPQDG